MHHWIPIFLEAMQAEQDAALNTLQAYARDLNDFVSFLDRTNRTPENAERDDIEAYLIEAESIGLAKSTRARRLSSIRQLYRFAFTEGWRTDDPAAQIKGPKRGRHLPITLSEADVIKLLDAAKKAAMTAIFNKLNNPDAAISQKGTITYVFKITGG